MRQRVVFWVILGLGVFGASYSQDNKLAFKPFAEAMEFPAITPDYKITKITVKEYIATEIKKVRDDRKYLAITLCGG